jgi:hypothetical protein
VRPQAPSLGPGPKRAAQLVRRHGTLDGVLNAGLFRTEAEMPRLYREIATMDASATLPSLADQTPTWVAAKAPVMVKRRMRSSLALARVRCRQTSLVLLPVGSVSPHAIVCSAER